jgi:hypothetical protein
MLFLCYSIYLSGSEGASAGDACTPTKIEILDHSPDILKPWLIPRPRLTN